MSVDTFQAETPGLSSPAFNLVAVTPSDSTDLACVSRAIHVAGNGGYVTVTTTGMQTGTSCQIFIASGSTFPVRATRVWQTGTSATQLVNVY